MNTITSRVGNMAMLPSDMVMLNHSFFNQLHSYNLCALAIPSHATKLVSFSKPDLGTFYYNISNILHCNPKHCNIHYIVKIMWIPSHPTVEVVQTLTTKLYRQNRLQCFCMLKHYNFSSQALKGPKVFHQDNAPDILFI